MTHFSYRARDGFMGIGPLWANNDDGTVYMQGHVVIPNPWGNVSTNGTTTTTTDDTTDKDGGDDAEPCGRFDAGCFNGHCFSDCWKRETGRSWSNDRNILSKIAEIEAELVKRGEISAQYTVSAVMFAAFGIGVAAVSAIFGGFPAAIGVLIAAMGGVFAVGALINTWETNKLKKERNRLMDENSWTKDSNELKKDLETCEEECCSGSGTDPWTGAEPLSEPGNFIVLCST